MDDNLEIALTTYLQTCNDVLNLHDRAVTDHVESDLACRILKGHPIKLVIYEDNLDNPCCQATIMYEKGRFMKTGPSIDKPEIIWTIDRRHIDEIAENPQEVLDHPEKLNWDCLASRVGVKLDRLKVDS
jgi:hypothetical protein